MSRLAWFRLYTEARNDRKLESFPDDEFRVWFRLLCYAAENDVRGICPYNGDNTVLAIEVANGDEELLSRAVKRMALMRMVYEEEGHLVFAAFAERQYDKPSDSPEASRERKRRQREREKGEM